jgi:predicted CXXCH cytochrome family protein
MTAGGWLLLFLVPALILWLQFWSALGRGRGTLAGFAAVLLLGGAWLLLRLPFRGESVARAGEPATSVTSDTCFKCHADHYNSWHQTYHRTMTREATPETIKGDFNNAAFTFQGITSHMTREGDAFYMETLDSAWAERVAEAVTRPTPPLRKYKVERLVGSHWFQECLTKDETGRYWRLPLSYHIVEGRWIHTNGAFLAADTDDFWSKSTVWNESCVFCHNTKPSKQPITWSLGTRRGRGYDTTVAELGIACEACHGPGSTHVRINQNPARRFAVRQSEAGDPTIVNPRRLSVARSDDICAHCHGATFARSDAWDPITLTDPFNAGDDLKRTKYFFRSEAEQELAAAGREPDLSRPPPRKPFDGRFWGDGTPLTTALEYNGMALSACYQEGQGQLNCLSCHSMHDSAPNFLLARGRETNDACYQCHASYRQRLAEHTHHAPDSSGSLCYNCHMPYQVYSLLTSHRSHRIDKLQVKDSLGTGKPHACNLCHLDKSLGWTQDRLSEWYGRKPEPLSEEERVFSSALLHLSRSDARTRIVVAGAFSWPAAHAASGTDWIGPMLTRLLEHERYPAVRYLAHRGLRVLYGAEAGPYDYLALSKERSTQLKAVRDLLDRRCRPEACNYPYLPLTADGRPANAVLDSLLRKRNDPDVSVHE